MDPEPNPQEEVTRGQEVEATLWGVVTRLRARDWQISLWEIQRAQDVIAYLFTRLPHPPTDDELLRHLRPVFCAKDSELAAFEDAFRQSAATVLRPDPNDPNEQRRRRSWPFAVAGAAVLAFCVAVVRFVPPSTSGSGRNGSPDGSVPGQDTFWTTSIWVGLATVLAATVIVILWLALHKQLRRRPGPRDPGHDLELRWATEHPLGTLECVRTARSLRARSQEAGNALDLRRTVEASIRAGMRLTPRFVQYKRSPEYLAIIEQRSAQDVLAAYHARIVDQISAQGVAMRRVGIQPRSRLVVDPVRGRRRLETLQPTSERERILLFAHDRALRDPFSGEARPWLTRFDRWSETTQIGPDVDQDHPLPVMHRVLRDVRALDPAWAPAQPRGQTATARMLPAVFETGDELWIEACAPSSQEVARALDLLVTSLGPHGWYWLSACALYPEINYELTVSLGCLLRGDDGEPVAAHLDIGVLAQLPWFRHAYMPDWLRATLISTLSHGQLVEARAALDQILVSGLVGTAEGSGSLSVAESRPSAGRRADTIRSPRAEEIKQDRVYLDGSALRRRRLAAAAPPQLVSVVRRRWHSFPTATLSSDAPSLRVRRALAWSNALLVVAALVSAIAIAILSVEAAGAGSWDVFYDEWYRADVGVGAVAVYTSLFAFVPGTLVLVFSRMAGRRRGVVTGISAVTFAIATLLLSIWPERTNADVLSPLIVVARLATLASTVAALQPSVQGVLVPWATFQRRCKRAFALSIGFVVLLTVMWSAIEATDFPSLSTRSRDLILTPTFVGLFAAGTTVLAAAYFAGVRFIPLLAGGTIGISGVCFTIANDTIPALLFGLPGLLVLGGFYWQVRRVAERPPLDFWETAWREWKWPLAIAAVAATATVTWYFSRDWRVVLWLTAIPAVASLLNLTAELISDRLAGTVIRFRLKSRLPFHFD